MSNKGVLAPGGVENHWFNDTWIWWTTGRLMIMTPGQVRWGVDGNREPD